MKYLTDVILEQELKALGKIVLTEKGIKLAEHALNFGPDHNAKKYLNQFVGLFKMHEKLAVMKEHLKSHDDINIKNKIATELIEFALREYDNRTIEIETEKGDSYERVADKLSKHKGMDFVVNYKYWSFEPLDISNWNIHKLEYGERLVFYALDYDNIRKNKIKEAEENQKIAMREIAHEIGRFAHDKPKKYMKWAKRRYNINDKEGLHMRPAAAVVSTANKYDGDIWIRTDNMEVNAKSIINVFLLKAKSDKEFTILYKPQEKAEQFYNDLELINYHDKETKEEKPLFARVR